MHRATDGMTVSHGTFRGVIALISVVGAFSLAIVQLVVGGTAEVPPWVVGLTSAIVAFYFGERSAIAATRANGGQGRRESDREHRPE